jgi:cyclic nucleotide gated channel
MTSKKEQSQLRIRDLEWWMRRRQLPARLRQRVCKYERQKWAATRGIDEEATVQDLPEGLRRDIKRHLCLDLVRQVPLFQQMDDLVLNNICERLKPGLFIKDETVGALTQKLTVIG